MAQTTGPWRVKGVDRQTRKLARDAAAKSGLSMGAWIDRTIKAEAGVPVRETAEPLVTEFLKSARNAGGVRKEAAPSDKSKSQGDYKRAKPQRVSPAIAAASRAQEPRMGRGVIGALAVVALMAGGFWLATRFPVGKDVTFAGSGRLDDGATSATADSGKATEAGQATPMTPIEKLAFAAQNGDIRAQHDLGLLYVQGNGVAKDPKKGAGLLEQSAKAGLPKAQYHVGVLYEKGLGVARNLEAAFMWYQRAADQGHVRAQHNLGTFYAEGKGTARNYTEAARWFALASKGGLAESHYSLGMIHEHGLGVAKDDRKAAAYYRSALAAGSAQAAAKLSQLEPAMKEAARKAEATLGSKVATTESATGAPANGDSVLSPASIMNLQRLLARLDLAPGPADGKLGEQTVEAIKLYQRFAGLPVDGKPSADLLRDLRQVVGAMDTDTPGAAAPAAAR